MVCFVDAGTGSNALHAQQLFSFIMTIYSCMYSSVASTAPLISS
jgi:hypothetical protein